MILMLVGECLFELVFPKSQTPSEEAIFAIQRGARFVQLET